MQSLYVILEVHPHATAEQIKEAYRRLLKLNHPDINTTPQAAERTRRIIEAYEVLSDARRRAQYDSLLLAYLSRKMSPDFNSRSVPPRKRPSSSKRSSGVSASGPNDRRITRLVIIVGIAITAVISSVVFYVQTKYVAPMPLVLESGRSFDQLPWGLKDAVEVQMLDLSRNRLEELNADFGTMQSLRQLKVEGNHIKSVTGKIWLLPQLEDVNLAHNELVSIPDSIRYAQRLMRLNLANNQLRQLPLNALQELTMLRVLEVTGNPMQSVYLDTLRGALPNVRVVY